METTWRCPQCKTKHVLDGKQKELFVCPECDFNALDETSRKNLNRLRIGGSYGPFYRLCWKHKEFPTSSRGPILRHTDDNLRPYTKKEAQDMCNYRNLHKTKHGLIRFWIEEVTEYDDDCGI